MTNEEKFQLIRGISINDYYAGFTKGIPRLDIPPLNAHDGPAGFGTKFFSKGVQFPSPMSMAASWNPQAVYKWAQTMAIEFRETNTHIQLAPGLNVNRLPQGGRNFEYLSGEDPYLGYVLSQPAVRGIQDQNVVANAKHFAMNE